MAVGFETRKRRGRKRPAEPEVLPPASAAPRSELGAPAGAPLYLCVLETLPDGELDTTFGDSSEEMLPRCSSTAADSEANSEFLTEFYSDEMATAPQFTEPIESEDTATYTYGRTFIDAPEDYSDEGQQLLSQLASVKEERERRFKSLTPRTLEGRQDADQTAGHDAAAVERGKDTSSELLKASDQKTSPATAKKDTAQAKPDAKAATDKKGAEAATGKQQEPQDAPAAGAPGTKERAGADVVAESSDESGDTGQSEDFSAETEEIEASMMEVEAEDEPFSFEAAPPLIWQPLAATFGVELELPRDALELPPLPAQESSEDKIQQDRLAIEAARSAYSGAAHQGKQQHDSLLKEAQTTTDKMRESYEASAARLPSLFLDASSDLDMAYERSQRALDEGLALAELDVELAWRQARRVVRATARRAHGRLEGAHNQAGKDIERMMKEIFEPFQSTITTAAKECADGADKALLQLNKWRDERAEVYEQGPTAVDKARDEAKLPIAPGLADAQATLLIKYQTEAADSYAKMEKDTRKQVEDGAKPPLEDRAKKISTEGQGAVTTAMEGALKQLRSQARDARKALREMHANAGAQLRAQRRAARARLRAQSRNGARGQRNEANAAIKGMQGGVKSSLSGYERPVSRLAESFKRAAERGAGALKNVARSALADVVRGITQSRRLQSERVTANSDSLRTMLEQREQRLGIDARADVSATDSQMDNAAVNIQAAMRVTAEQHTRAFASAASGIEQTADNWAKPLSEVFPNYVEKTKEKNKENHTTWAKEVNDNKKKFTDWAKTNEDPDKLFAPQLDPPAAAVNKKINDVNYTLRRELSAGWHQNIHEEQVTGALHGLTKKQGAAVEEEFLTAGLGPLRTVLYDKLWEADYMAAINFLSGDVKEGARWELKASVHWYNDEESRMEAVMRSLTPEQRKELGETEFGKEAVEDAKDALGDVDLKVFNALEAGKDARADAYRMLEKINDARKDRDKDAVIASIAEYTTAPKNWTGREKTTADERRVAVEREFAAILAGVEPDKEAPEISQAEAEKTLEEYALKPIPPPPSKHGARPAMKFEGAEHDLGVSLIKYGESNPETRAARLGVEIQRPGGPKALNLDTAFIDERLNPNNKSVTPEEQKKALEERDYMFQIFAEKYGGVDQSLTAEAAKELTKEKLEKAYGTDELGAKLAAAYVDEPHLSPENSSIAMRYAMKGAGTNEELGMRTVGRMNRTEISEMKGFYQAQTGSDLYSDLGVFGHKAWYNFGEFSGDEALQLEVKLLGIPQNDQERAEVAFLQAQQQLNETGDFGKELASGTLAERDLNDALAKLKKATGGDVKFDDEGNPVWSGGPLFNADGSYSGEDRRALDNAVQIADLAAQNYAAKIDSYANAATMGIAIAGAIVAAVVSVVTGGLASPLLMAAIAGISGLAAAGTHAAISGGRYGWEQAATDIGMAAVQAATAGIGQKLALASRGISAAARPQMLSKLLSGQMALSKLPAMGQITGSGFADMMLMGATTGGLGSLGQTALSEQTWDKGLEHGVGQMFEATIRGILSGAATSVASNAFEALPIERAREGVERATIGSLMGDATNPLLRGLLRGSSSAIGAFAGRETEMGFESATGRFKGDAGDIFQAGLEAAGQSAFQDAMGGAAEAPLHGRVKRKSETPTGGPRPTTHAPEEHATATAKLTPSDEVSPVAPRPPHEPEETQAMPVIHKTPSDEHAPPVITQARETTEPAPPPPAKTARQAEEADPLTKRLAEHEEAQTKPQRETESVDEKAAAVTQRLARPEVADVPAPPQAPRQFAEGAAASVQDSDFHGRAAKPGSKEAAKPSTVKGALHRLNNTSEFAGVHMPNPSEPNHLVLTTASGEKVTVRVRLSEKIFARTADEAAPVARFKRDPATGEYIVEVSAGALARHVERALAHEIAEIRAGHGREQIQDVLVPGKGKPAVTGEEGKAQLSPHDEGRLAELGVIARELKMARTEKQAAQLVEEAKELIAHLGLGGLGEAADARRDIAFKALDKRPDAQDLLVAAVQAHTPAAVGTETVQAGRGMAKGGGLVDEDMRDLPGLPPLARREGDPRPGRTQFGSASPDDPQAKKLNKADELRITGSLRAASRRAFGRALHDALLDPSLHTPLTQKTLEYLTPDEIDFVLTTRRLPKGFEYHHLLAVADYPEFAHRGDVGLGLPPEIHKQIAHGGETSRELEAATFVDREAEGRPPFHLDPEGRPYYRPKEFEVAQGTRSLGDTDADLQKQFKVMVEDLEPRLKKLEKQIPRAEERVQKLKDDLASLEKALEEATAEGKSTVGLKKKIEKKQEVLDRAQERLSSLTWNRDFSTHLRAAIIAFQQSGAAPPPTPPATPVAGTQGTARATPAPHAAPATPAQPPTGTALPQTSPQPAHPTAPAQQAGQPPHALVVSGTQAPPAGDFGKGTAAGLLHSDFSGGAAKPGTPKAASIDKCKQAVSQLLAHDKLLTGAARLPDTQDPSLIHLTTSGKSDVKVRIVMADNVLPPGPDGVPPAASFKKIGDGSEYVVEVSPGTPARHVERALAHELKEIWHGHGQQELPDALKPGGFGSEAAPKRVKPQLSAHDQGRLAELEVLGRQMDEARAAGKRAELAALRDDTQRLLAHMGLTDDTRASQLRLELVLDTLEHQPAVAKMLKKEAAAAQENPFLRLPPTDAGGYLDHLLDRMAYAQKLGDKAKLHAVMEQARFRIKLGENNKISFMGPDGSEISYKLDYLKKAAADPKMRRSKMFQELIEYRTQNAPPTDFQARPIVKDPASLDPDLVAAVKRHFLDYKLDPKQYQDWPTFSKRYLGDPLYRKSPPTQEELTAAFHLWMTGHEVSASDKVASVMTSTSRADVTTDYKEKAHPEYKPDSALDVQQAKKRTGRTLDEMMTARDNAIKEREALTQEKKKNPTPDRLHEINKRLKELIPLINKPGEQLGEAAGIRFARDKYNLSPAHESKIFVGEGANVPDIMFVDPGTKRIVIIEAKGNESQLRARRSKDRTQMVQQGTYKYLESLAHDMQTKVQDPAVQKLGLALEVALREGKVDYYMVRQPLNADSSLGVPMVAKFDVSKNR